MPKHRSILRDGLSGILKEYAFWIGLIGALVSAGPIISLTQKLFDIGLVPILASALAYYREITYPLVDWLRSIISYIPLLDFYGRNFSRYMSLDTYRDLVSLSFVLATAMLRATNWASAAILRKRLSSQPSYFMAIIVGILFTIVVSYTLLVFLLILIMIVTESLLKTGDVDKPFLPYFLLYLLVAFSAAAAFFAANELMKL